MSDRDTEMVTLREQRDDAIQRMVRAEMKLHTLRALLDDPVINDPANWDIKAQLMAVLEADDV